MDTPPSSTPLSFPAIVWTVVNWLLHLCCRDGSSTQIVVGGGGRNRRRPGRGPDRVVRRIWRRSHQSTQRRADRRRGQHVSNVLCRCVPSHRERRASLGGAVRTAPARGL